MSLPYPFIFEEEEELSSSKLKGRRNRIEEKYLCLTTCRRDMSLLCMCDSMQGGGELVKPRTAKSDKVGLSGLNLSIWWRLKVNGL